MNKLLSQPTFIPKINDSALEKVDIEIPAALMEAHIVEQKHKVFESVQAKATVTIIDPINYFAQYKECSEKANFKKLPYAQEGDLDKLYSDPTYRLENIVKPTLHYQIDKGSSLIIAPYLFSEDMNSISFSTNITMLSESIIHLRSEGVTTPLFAQISINSSVLSDIKSVNFIVDRYKDELVKEGIQGYFILVNDLDDRDAEEQTLLGLAHMVFQLSRDKEVIINHIGGFGEILNIIGASGFSSSLAAGETFSTKTLQSNYKGPMGRDHNEWKYVPELFDYVNEAELAPNRIDYQCKCMACMGNLDVDSQARVKKLHFLLRRMDAINSLNTLPHTEQIKAMVGRLESGIAQATTYTSRYGLNLRISHMIRWKNVLQASQTWDYEDNDEELEALLSDLEE